MKHSLCLSLALLALPSLGYAQILQIEKTNTDPLLVQIDDIKEMRFKTAQNTYEDKTPECVEIIDLGLSVNWASVNLGATLPEAPGYLISWGELEEKDWYSWSGYKYGSSSSTLTKYCLTDGMRILQPEDDAATMLWGGDWRMPSREEWQELIDNCEIDYLAEENGYPGVRLTSKVPGYEDKSIFLVAAGWIQDEYHLQDGNLSSYWANECAVFPGEISLPEFAFAAEFWRQGDYANSYYYSGVYRWQGRPIRAVQSKEKSSSTSQNASFVIELIDGSTQKYASTEEPVVSFEDENLVVKFGLMETSFDTENIARIYFEFIETDINNAVVDDMIFYYDGSNIIINGKACMLSIHDVNGKIYHNALTNDGYNSIDISGYNLGIYIVKANNQTIKILKK